MVNPKTPDGPQDPEREASSTSTDNDHRDTTRDFTDEQQAQFNATLAGVEETFKQASSWFDNLQTLVTLELRQTIAASKRMLVLQLVLVPLMLLLFLTICIGVGVIAYYFSQSAYIGFAAFFGFQVLLALIILLSLRKLRGYVGFTQSKQQVKEAFHDVFETTR